MKFIYQIPSPQRRISVFLSVALFLHGLLLFGVQDGVYKVHPALPDWMNIKLVAGIDESIHQDPSVKPQQTMPEAMPLKNSTVTSEQPLTEQIEPQQTQAQHFVKADSRPYEHQNPKPFYPAAARRRGMQGQVLLQLEVNVRGKVSKIAIKQSSGFRLLDEAAISTVSQWRFIPASKDHQAIVSIVEVPIKFELKQF